MIEWWYDNKERFPTYPSSPTDVIISTKSSFFFKVVNEVKLIRNTLQSAAPKEFKNRRESSGLIMVM